MSIQVVCTCGKKLSAPDSAAGKRAKCPACGSPVLVPSREPPVDSTPQPEGDLSSFYDEELSKASPATSGPTCPSCGSPVAKGATKCGTCGEKIASNVRLDQPSRKHPRAGHEQTAAGLEKVAIGLLLVLAGIALITISIILVTFGPILLPQLLGVRLTASILMAVPYFAIVGGLLGTAGRVLCLLVPRSAGAHAFILGSVGLELAALGIGFADAAAELPAGASSFGSLCSLASLVLFVLFMKRLAAFVGQPDLAEEAQTLVTTGLLLIGLFIATAVITVVAPGFACVGGLVGLGCFIVMLMLLFRYVRLINDLRQAVLDRTRR